MEKIKQLRKQKKIKLKDMANDLGISKTTLWRIESNDPEFIGTGLCVFVRIAKYFDIDLKDLI